MKKIKTKYDDLLSYEKIVKAYKDTSKNKNKNRNDIRIFNQNPEFRLRGLLNSLEYRKYKPKGYTQFTLRDTKPRLICAPEFRDSIVQRLIYNEIYPQIVIRTIAENMGCRVGKGLQDVRNYIQKELNKYDENLYYLHLDIRKYFYNLKHENIIKILSRFIKDKELVKLISLYLPVNKGDKIGVPIGNLISQMIGMLYLNDLDHYIKRDLKIKSYCRYVDDFILIGLTKEEVNNCLNKIITFINNKLDLELSKIKINRIEEGVDFCGYRVWKDKTLTRKRNIKKYVKSLKRNDSDSIVSRLEYSKNTNSFDFYIKLLLKYAKRKYIIIPKVVVNKYNINIYYNNT